MGWLATKLPNEKKLPAELKDSIQPLFLCLADRNPDVRTGANTCVPLFMAHTGYDAMFKATAKLKDVSRIFAYIKRSGLMHAIEEFHTKNLGSMKLYGKLYMGQYRKRWGGFTLWSNPL